MRYQWTPSKFGFSHRIVSAIVSLVPRRRGGDPPAIIENSGRIFVPWHPSEARKSRPGDTGLTSRDPLDDTFPNHKSRGMETA